MLQRTLVYNPEARELRLILAELWNAQHERTEYRVINDDGTPVRRGQEWDGQTAYTDSPGAGGYYIRGVGGRRITFRTEKTAAAESKTPCRRLASRSGRAKCPLCPQ
jgi:hypothetical protein